MFKVTEYAALKLLKGYKTRGIAATTKSDFVQNEPRHEISKNLAF